MMMKIMMTTKIMIMMITTTVMVTMRIPAK